MIDCSMVKCKLMNQELEQVILSLNEVNFTAFLATPKMADLNSLLGLYRWVETLLLKRNMYCT